MVMLTGYNDMQGGDTPYSYYLNATGRVRFAPTFRQVALGARA